MNKLSYIAEKAARILGEPRDIEEALYPVPDDLKEEFNVPYKGRDGNELYTDIYRLKDTEGEKLPVIVIVHGGGLFAGRPIMERRAAEAFARRGYLVFVPSYRLIAKTDACGEISDICAAFDFAGKEAEGRGGDPERVFAVAESAGAFLVEYAAAMQGSERLCEVNLLISNHDSSDDSEPTFQPAQDLRNITVGRMVELLDSHPRRRNRYLSFHAKDVIDEEKLGMIEDRRNAYIEQMKQIPVTELAATGNK